MHPDERELIRLTQAFERNRLSRELSGDDEHPKAADDQPQPLSRPELKSLLSRKLKIRKEESTNGID